jgi:eukaryotic-like serine/threonine-protein kinase
VLADDELKRQAEARVGTVLEGKWRLDALLGVGGMASVYAATHRNSKRVAVKLLHPHLSFDGHIRERFLREGYAANQVKHPGVVAVHDEDTTSEGAAFLVMELLDGESVAERWQKNGYRLAPEEVLRLTEELLDTLAAAHEKGIVHRDIKPENLFLTRDGKLKVLDFGIARLRELSSSISATRTGSMLGTPAFMAPEQAKGRWNEVDAWTDLWAVGATMFTLLTGDYVHQGNTPNEMLALTITQPARSIGSVFPELHPALAAVVDRALAYQKQDRWPDARAMRKAVEAARSEVERSGGPYVREPVPATTALDAEVAQRRRRISARPDAATVAADSVGNAPAAPQTSTTLRSRTGPGGTRRRSLVLGAWATLLAAGTLFAVLATGGSRGAESLPSAARPESQPRASAPRAGVSVLVRGDDKPAADADAGAPPTPSQSRPTVVVRQEKAARKTPDPTPAAKSPPKAKASADPFARRR